jgi:hypothetical protein
MHQMVVFGINVVFGLEKLVISLRRRSRVGSQYSYTPSAWSPGWMPIATSGLSTFFVFTYLNRIFVSLLSTFVVNI